MYTHKHTNFTLRAKFLSYRIKNPPKQISFTFICPDGLLYMFYTYNAYDTAALYPG